MQHHLPLTARLNLLLASKTFFVFFYPTIVSPLLVLFWVVIQFIQVTLLLLFFFILKNPQENNEDYYLEFFSLLIPFFVTTFLLRIPFIKKAKKQLWDEKVFFNVLLIGSEKNALQFFNSFLKLIVEGHVLEFLPMTSSSAPPAEV